MPNYVIHGTGKPRLYIYTSVVHTNTVASATATSVVLTTEVDLTTLDGQAGLTNREIITYSSGEITVGKITSYSDSVNTLYTASWSNGTPTAGQAVTIRNFRIDLPYCQKLIETWQPDFISHKLQNGKIATYKRGFYYSSLLDYSNYASVDLVASLYAIYRTDYTAIQFTPRADNLNISYRVDIDPKAKFEIQQRQNHRGHRLVKIELIGIERLSNINLFVSSSLTGYGEAPYGGSDTVGYGDN